jgi:hypothetical protein
MTTKQIVYTRPDGGVSVVSPASAARLFDETEDEFIARIQAKDVPGDALDIEVVEGITIPTDRWFRDAWTRALGGGPIGIDLAVARSIHGERMSTAIGLEIARLATEERKSRLKGNTAAADAAKTDKASIEALNLAALATQLGTAPNVAALKAIWPAKVPK